MKFFKQLLALIALPTLFFGSPVLAATYPATCPAEAQGIVDAVGGCATINPTDYSAIYGKCCSAPATPTTLTDQITTQKSSATPLIAVTLVALVAVGVLAVKRFWKK
ncbi:MAG: hypothetical protein A3C93_00845 [Candidatus Lloydbacteria bacterium RIFCSPHIGHO2_02_FULL_54_17]|uniref:Gram-positive cocci surface proteins LPxTG domain-containing protein n=1 Tax=Candidatus Lloydbacteria bacterium RIFCSPHIGHO2_02_FULL_54_17 TaxID=1798664 RepID=A0A1G2DHN4_9BACT|nr:MAG: hypothetical protein A2762_05025 [Candidatus Lloydbacteria bacterium RIFCSPHIGHO2_01_FULL_54_11]OGZ13184.1 MAG: hypothetical protein A3C93_00845 [Candidatus Lloydbacteria bacterium RIFCSPHIGHO2_02_FULL_54_17]OGZ16070.1 MAG: hypothetical protein A3H76_01425 [Candidatus Lloydbacteria bacterium RIFCSPLOWO2_02_FULL_54_12]